MATINTRLLLKTDLTSKWIDSVVKIYKGEVALGLNSETNKYEIRIGTDTAGKTWNELSSNNLTIPASNVIGLNDALYDYRLDESTKGIIKLQKRLHSSTSESDWLNVTTVTLSFTEGTYSSNNPIALKDYVDGEVAKATTQYFEGIRGIITPQGEDPRPETDSEVIARITSGHTVKGGTTAVVKTLLSEGKYEYIAFTYDTTTDSSNPSWKAMDGNYDWEHVIATSDLTLAGDYTQVGNITKTKTETKTYSSSGKSVKDLFAAIFTKTQPPSVTNPSVSVTSKNGSTNIGSNQILEVGTSVSPGYSASLNPGSYTAFTGQVATGVTASSWSATLYSGTTVVDTKTTNADTFNALTLEDNTTEHKITVTAQHGAGNYAKNNIGEVTDIRVEAGSKSSTTYYFKGYKMGRFYGGSNVAKSTASLTSANIRALTASGSSDISGSWSFEVPVGTATVIFAVRGDATLTKAFNDTVYADMTSLFEANKGTLVVAGADNDVTKSYASSYTIWTYTPAEAYASATNFTITIAID